MNTMQNLEDFYTGAQSLVAKFDAFAAKHTLHSIARADHLCYKCGSAEEFERIRAIFEQESEYLHQAIISKRRIAYIKLKKGVETALGSVLFLELSDQKPDNSQQGGFDHIEVYPTAMSYEEMVARLQSVEEVVKVERPHHTTHDINMGEGFLFRCTHGPLIEKIKESEMS